MPISKASHVILATQSKGSRDSLTLCPLKFTDKTMEAEFAYNQERAARYRNVLGGLTASGVVLVNLGVGLAAWHTGMFLQDPSIFGSFLTFIVGCLFFCMTYANAYRIPVIQRHLEYASYFICTAAVVVQSTLSLWWKTQLNSKENFLRYAPHLTEVFGLPFDPYDPGEPKDSIAYHIVVLYHELVLGVVFQSTLLAIFVLMNLVTPTRFFIASRLQIVITLIGIIPFIYGAFQLPETLLPK